MGNSSPGLREEVACTRHLYLSQVSARIPSESCAGLLRRVSCLTAWPAATVGL